MVSNEKSLTEENSNLALDDAFSSEVVRENNSKPNEEIVSGKKAERKKASKDNLPHQTRNSPAHSRGRQWLISPQADEVWF